MNELTKRLLEQMIDALGLARVVEALGEICGDKAEHLESNWQDPNGARDWNVLGGWLMRLAERISRYEQK